MWGVDSLQKVKKSLFEHFCGQNVVTKQVYNGLPKEAAEKHMQKRIAELTADQAQEDDTPQQ